MKKILGVILLILSSHSVSFAQSSDIVISGEWARPVLIAGRPGGAFFTIENKGDQADRLVSAEANIAQRTEIHDHIMTDGVMRMVQMEEGLEIPAGGTVELKPGSFHIMMFETDNKYGPGETIDLKLNFENAGTIEKTLEIKARQPE